MPLIENGEDVLYDIYHLGEEPAKTEFINGIYKMENKVLVVYKKKATINNNQKIFLVLTNISFDDIFTFILVLSK